MLFPNLTVFQNVLFLIACVGIFLLITYIILVCSGYIVNHKLITSDDIDNDNENFDVKTFILNAFTIKGSIFFLAVFTVCGFILSLFLTLWLALVIAGVLGIATALLSQFFEREHLAATNDLGIVNQRVPAKNQGTGKVILLKSGAEIIAESEGNAIKKGRLVIICEKNGNKNIVKKYKKGSK